MEVKAGKNVSRRDLKPLRMLAEEGRMKRYLCVCMEPRPRRVDGVDVVPYREFLRSLWSGEYR